MCYMAIALALVLFIQTATRCDGTQTQYLEKPANMEKAEGQSATFTCVAINANLIWWTINGFAMTRPEFRDLGGAVVLTDHPTNKSVSISNLTVPANMATNGARVVCNLVPLLTITSSHVTLDVQGTFEPVRDITLKNTSYTVVVQWSPPDHLPSIPPTNYNITIINTTSEEIIDSDTLTTTNHTFHLSPEHLCSVLLIRIVAYNQWLSGQPGITAWSLGGAVKPNSIGQHLRYFVSSLRLSITFEVVGYCLDLLDTILLETICGNTTLTNVSSNATDVDTSGIVSGPHELSIDSLPEDERCSFRIVLNTTTGRTTPSQPTMFDTFDIISVNFSIESTTICIQCRFIPGSSAQGCQIIQLDFRSKIVDMFNISRINEAGSGCFNTEPGEYTLVAYDINADTTLSSPYESAVVIVSTPPVPISTPAVVTVSPSITPPTTVLGIGPIIGISVGGGVFIAAILCAAIIICIAICSRCCGLPTKRRKAFDGPPEFDSTSKGFVLRRPETVDELLDELVDLLKKEHNITENAKLIICPLDGDDRQPLFTKIIPLEDSDVQDSIVQDSNVQDSDVQDSDVLDTKM